MNRRAQCRAGSDQSGRAQSRAGSELSGRAPSRAGFDLSGRAPSRAGLLLVLFPVVAMGCLFAGCARPGPREEPARPPPEVTLYGVRMSHFRDGHVAALGRAARVTYQRASGELIAYESYLRFPSRNAAPPPPRPRGRRTEPAGMELRAPLVVGNLGNRQAEAQGGVLLRSSTGMAGQTDRMFFDGNALTARGESRVKVTAPGYTLEADRFSLLFEPEEFTFDGNVESRLGGKQ